MSRSERATDLRALFLGVGAWLGALIAALLAGPAAIGSVVVLSAVVGVLVARRALALGWLAPLAALVAVSGVSVLHQTALTTSPVKEWAQSRAVVTATVAITSDARTVRGSFGDTQIVRARIIEAHVRDQGWTLNTPVLVLADSEWSAPPLGSRVVQRWRLNPATGDVAAMARPIGVSPDVTSEPGPAWAAAAVRASVREAVSGRHPHQAALVPALVTGDDSTFDPDLAEDFRDTGLTHLLAVSGTNLTLVVGFLVVLGRWAGVRGRAMWALAAVGIVFFVLVARTEPSVVRAAAMGTVALVGLGSNGRSRGTRCLGAAVFFLLLYDPGLALTAGFALSVLATAGILLLAPPWRDAMTRWLPRWAAEAISVPLAAQVACTPVVAGISGDVSLVAVVANLIVAPAVGPATVLGLGGGLVGLVWAPLGAIVAAPGAWSAGWIVSVATHAAALPTPAIEWGTGPWALALLTALCLASIPIAPRLLGHPVTAVGCCLILVLAITVRLPTPGWPPRDWVLVACDVGQGDALVLNAGGGSAIVVDAGPDASLVDRCLSRLRIDRVPLVVLTHFHADHVDGLSGVMRGREVGAVESTWLAAPESGVESVRHQLGGLPRLATYPVTRQIGGLSLQTVWPARTDGYIHADAANDNSVVLLVEAQGVRILLTGDVEPPGQASLRRTLAGLQVDVLKVPHHGSRHQDLPWLTSLEARVALISVGEDNDYGHPSDDVVAALEGSGTTVWRTDLAGDIAVSSSAGEVGVWASR